MSAERSGMEWQVYISFSQDYLELGLPLRV